MAVNRLKRWMKSANSGGGIDLLDFDDIAVNRMGKDEQSYMITDAVIGSVSPGNSYQVTHAGLIQTDKDITPGYRQRSENTVPPNVCFTGSWGTSDDTTATEANILGGFGSLHVQQSPLEIPEAPTTAATLAYYGARLIELDDVIEFESDAVLPVTLVSIGSTYVDNYLQVEEFGGGAYIEYHDRPHLHMPIEACTGGHLILGRSSNDEYRLSAFRIPFGFGIYTPPYLLHADAYLVGKFLVVYSVTPNFSTVIFRSSKQQLVDVQIGKTGSES